MRLFVNGQNREFPELINILELLETLELNPERVVVELNRDILTAAKYADTRLKDGDNLELIQFVGGG
jgi:sulfur carrier protein